MSALVWDAAVAFLARPCRRAGSPYILHVCRSVGRSVGQSLTVWQQQADVSIHHKHAALIAIRLILRVISEPFLRPSLPAYDKAVGSVVSESGQVDLRVARYSKVCGTMFKMHLDFHFSCNATDSAL